MTKNGWIRQKDPPEPQKKKHVRVIFCRDALSLSGQQQKEKKASISTRFTLFSEVCVTSKFLSFNKVQYNLDFYNINNS